MTSDVEMYAPGPAIEFEATYPWWISFWRGGDWAVTPESVAGIRYWDQAAVMDYGEMWPADWHAYHAAREANADPGWDGLRAYAQQCARRWDETAMKTFAAAPVPSED